MSIRLLILISKHNPASSFLTLKESALDVDMLHTCEQYLMQDGGLWDVSRYGRLQQLDKHGCLVASSFVEREELCLWQGLSQLDRH